jgi:hypothetical protein
MKLLCIFCNLVSINCLLLQIINFLLHFLRQLYSCKTRWEVFWVVCMLPWEGWSLPLQKNYSYCYIMKSSCLYKQSEDRNYNARIMSYNAASLFNSDTAFLSSNESAAASSDATNSILFRQSWSKQPNSISVWEEICFYRMPPIITGGP